MKKIVNWLLDHYFVFVIYGVIGWIYEVSWFLIVRHKFVNRGVLFGPLLPVYGFGILILLLILKKMMTKKHYLNNLFYLIITTVTIVTFVYTTVVEYTTPKIYSVDYFLIHYGVQLVLLNIIAILLVYTFLKDKKIDVTIILVFLGIWIITTIIEYVAHYLTYTYFNKLLWDYTYDFLNINSRVNWDASRNFAIGGTALLYGIQPFIDKLLLKIKIKHKLIIFALIFVPMMIDIIINVL